MPTFYDTISAAAEDLGCEILWNDEIESGDTYLAKGYTGEVKLLTCNVHIKDAGYVIPVEKNETRFSTNQCVKVR